MSPLELEVYLHEHIPLTRAMQVSVREISKESVVISAPLAPNINHRETAFGVSVAGLATIAAWSLVHTRLLGHGVSSRLVIQSNTMSYDAPVLGEFFATSSLPGENQWTQFLRMLERKGKARITVSSMISTGTQVAGRFEGEFVALKT